MQGYNSKHKPQSEKCAIQGHRLMEACHIMGCHASPTSAAAASLAKLVVDCVPRCSSVLAGVEGPPTYHAPRPHQTVQRCGGRAGRCQTWHPGASCAGRQHQPACQIPWGRHRHAACHATLLLAGCHPRHPLLPRHHLPRHLLVVSTAHVNRPLRVHA